MAIFNLGSINIDYVYRLRNLPLPGETIAALSHSRGLGGKGANQSVAASQAGAELIHIGAIGATDQDWLLHELTSHGVRGEGIAQLDIPSGHAIISVDENAENQILLFAGANQHIPEMHIKTMLSQARSDDWLLMQNEANGQEVALREAKARGMRIAYAAAPFDAQATAKLLPELTLLLLNEVEAEQLETAIGTSIGELKLPLILVSKGADGVELWRDGHARSFPAYDVIPVDTTGAGDTLSGYFLAALDQGIAIEEALSKAQAAAAIQVTKHGAAHAIPGEEEVRLWLNAQNAISK